MALLHLVGRRFPAVGLICPTEGETICAADAVVRRRRSGAPWYQYSLGCDQTGWYVPCENGALVDVGNRDRGPLVDVHLYSRHCRLNREPCGCAIWLPISMGIARGHLVSNECSDALGAWIGAEPEWAVELIDRVSLLPVLEPDGPLATPVSVEAIREQEAAR